MRMMQIRNIRLRCIRHSCCLTLIAVVSCGCQQVEKQNCTAQMPCLTETAVPPNVVVIGHEAPREHLPALQDLTTEIRNSLALLGGLHLLDSPTVMQDRPCDGSFQPALQPMAVDEIQTVGHTAPVNAPLIPPAFSPGISPVLPPVRASSDYGTDYPMDKYEVRIVINEFLRYRPMRLAGTITIYDTSTDSVIHTIQNTWYAPPDCNPIADADCSLQKSLRRPEPGGHLERKALAVLSPQRFLYQIAKQVAPEIQSACLPYRCFAE